MNPIQLAEGSNLAMIAMIAVVCAIGVLFFVQLVRQYLQFGERRRQSKQSSFQTFENNRIRERITLRDDQRLASYLVAVILSVVAVVLLLYPRHFVAVGFDESAIEMHYRFTRHPIRRSWNEVRSVNLARWERRHRDKMQIRVTTLDGSTFESAIGNSLARREKLAAVATSLQAAFKAHQKERAREALR